MVNDYDAAAALLSFKSLTDAGHGILAVREFHKWLESQVNDPKCFSVLQKFIELVPSQMLYKG